MFIEKRVIGMDALRHFCYNYNLYTRGNNGDFSHMLLTASGIDNLTTEDILDIASDILYHSDTSLTIDAIMFYLINEYSITYILEEEE